MDQDLFGRRNLKQRVMIGGDVTQSITNHEQQISRLHPRHQRAAATEADITDILIAAVIEHVLGTKAGNNRQIIAFDKCSELFGRSGRPAEISDNDQRSLRFLQQRVDVSHLRV